MASVFNALSKLPAKTRKTILDGLDGRMLERLYHDWMVWAREDQLPPRSRPDGTPWHTWLILGGRGSGKTRTGAEWVRARALGLTELVPHRAHRIALVGRTIGQVRDIMIEGVSGIMSVHAPEERPTFEATRNQLVWPNGTIAQIFAADEPENLRGPQFDAAWCDELTKWRRAEAAWDNLQFALRLGPHPQACITTTPKNSGFLKRLMADPATITTRSRTLDNATNLAPGFIKEMHRRYGGTPIGRQELDGEIVEERLNGLWRRSWIDQNRMEGKPEVERIVVAVDPPVTSAATSDSCGIVVAGLMPDGRAAILADRTIQGRTPDTWARATAAAYHDFEADRIVAEVNQGGDLVVSVLHQVDPTLPVQKVRATRGKWLRAEPVAQLYAEGRVVHVGTFPELERQMCDFGNDGLSQGRSPDRLDALVWALTDLLLTPRRIPTVRRL